MQGKVTSCSLDHLEIGFNSPVAILQNDRFRHCPLRACWATSTLCCAMVSFDMGLRGTAHPSAGELGHSSLVPLLFRNRDSTQTAAPQAEGCLFRLLRDPPNLAVPQGRRVFGDVYHKEGSSVERSSSEGRRLLAGAGLADNTSVDGPNDPFDKEESLTSTELYGTKDRWDITSPKSQSGKSEGSPESMNKFPPDPPSSVPEGAQHKGPWWRELLASPVKKLRLAELGRNFRALAMPSYELPPVETPTTGILPFDMHTKVTDQSQGSIKPKSTLAKVRKDLPKRSSGAKLPKPNRRSAVKLAKAKCALAGIVARVERDFCANSSRAARASKRNTIKQILRAGNEGFPLTPFSLKLLAGTLCESGYKSAHSYLIEAKLEHVEAGHHWTSLLDRHFKLCMAAAKRGTGPRKKAAEVPEGTWTDHSLLEDPSVAGLKVLHSALLFACGVHWMMREIELSNLHTEDIRFDCANRMVTILWRESKKDTEGIGISRTLQCLCENGCDLKCPYAVLETLVNHATLRGTPMGAIAMGKKGRLATKADIVHDWRKLYGKDVTGHSTRRSGALQYIRKGWAVSQVGYLGRWKSNIMMEYAQEALESMAVNNTQCFGVSGAQLQMAQQLIKGNAQCNDNQQLLVTKADAVVVQKLKEELETFKGHTLGSHVALENAIKDVEDQVTQSSKYLPKMVKSVRQQVIHANVVTLVYAPPITWRTKCGWYYHASNYEFTDGDVSKVSCIKCRPSAPVQGGGES